MNAQSSRLQPESAEQTQEIAFATPADAESFCGKLYKTLDMMIALINRETRLLKAMEIADAELLQTEKSQLAARFNKEIALFKEHADIVGSLAPKAVETLARRHGELRTSLAANEEILSTLRSVSESLIRKTADRMQAKAAPKTYAPANSAPKRAVGAAAVALDRKL